MERTASLQRLGQRRNPWDAIVIGGGATGVAIALDAAGRGLACLLLEQADFGKGTSSRSTKLIHGGVRYLRQGNIALVRDALRERALLRNNAPHLVRDIAFLIPCRNRWQRFFYGVGLKVYDWLATGDRFGRSHGVSAARVLQLIPTIRPESARGGVIYHDGQFDDTRLLISMARTAEQAGACLVNYMPVTGLEKDGSGKVCGVTAGDSETGEVRSIPGRCVINATGPFCDAVREMDAAHQPPMLTASQGVHIVLPRRFLPGDTAMIVPKTSDGRVLFIIPWHNHTIVGTTDTPIAGVSLEPSAQAAEIDFLLKTTRAYLAMEPTKADILSVFTGIRPLLKRDRTSRTASLSRDHVIRVSDTGLITIAGGKWTTVRKMAEDCVDRVVAQTGCRAGPCLTQTLKLHGYLESNAGGHLTSGGRGHYGSDLAEIERLEGESSDLARRLHPDLNVNASEVIWAARHEMARTVEDVLARRTRCLFLNAAASIQMAPEVARLMAAELNRDATWVEGQVSAFLAVANHFQVVS